MNRYAAKLLFQFRVQIGRDSGKRRICEERIVILSARSAKDALRRVKQKGKRAQYDYLNSDGNSVYFEFIGVMDLLHLGSECDEDEVWYDITQHLLPMERKRKLIPRESNLNALRHERLS